MPTDGNTIYRLGILMSTLNSIEGNSASDLDLSSTTDVESFKRFLASRGIVKESFPVRYDFDCTTFTAKRFREPLRELSSNVSMYTLIEKGGFVAPKLEIDRKLAKARSFETVDKRKDDEKFLEDTKAKGSQAEPIWGDNGHTVHPACCLLPSWEALKVKELKPIRNALWSMVQPFDERFNNNIACICDGFLFFATLGRIQVTPLDELLDEGAEARTKLQIPLALSYKLYFEEVEVEQLNNSSRPVDRDLEIHFMKVSKFYDHKVLCACTESGLTFIFKIDDIIEQQKIKGIQPNMKDNNSNHLLVTPRIILNTHESSWSLDIFDEGPTKFIAIGHNRPGITVFAHRRRNRTLITCEIPVKHNVPSLNFVKKSSSVDGAAYLAYGSIFGNVSTVKLECNIGSGYSAIIKWEYFDTEFLADWCWSVTPVSKRDFHIVHEFEYLNNNFNESHKEKYLTRIYQDSLILKFFPSSLTQSSHLGIGARIAQISVPVVNLSLFNELHNNTRRIALRFTTFIILSNSEVGNHRYSEAFVKEACFAQNSSRGGLLLDEEHGYLLTDDLALGDNKVEAGYADPQENWTGYPFTYDRYGSSIRIPFIIEMRVKCKLRTMQITDPHKDPELLRHIDRNRLNGLVTLKIGTSFESKKCLERFPRIFQGVVHDSSTHYVIWDRIMQGGLSRETPIYDYDPSSGSNSDRDSSIMSIEGSSSRGSPDLQNLERENREHSNFDNQGSDLPDSESTRALQNLLFEASVLNEASFQDMNQSAETMGIDVGSLIRQIRRLFGNFRLVGLNDSNTRRASPIFQPDSFFDLGRATDAMKFWSLNNYVKKVERLLQMTDSESRYSSQGPKFNSVLSSDVFFVVTTNSRVFLLNGNPLMITSFTSSDIFPVKHIKSCRFLDRLERLNRISLVCFIKELKLIVVASQVGLVSLLRLTSYNGIYSFRQEYIFGWKTQNPRDPHAQCMRTFVKGDNCMNCLEDDTIFEMYNISGMDYTFIAADSTKKIPEHAILYVISRDTVYRFKIYK